MKIKKLSLLIFTSFFLISCSTTNESNSEESSIDSSISSEEVLPNKLIIKYHDGSEDKEYLLTDGENYQIEYPSSLINNDNYFLGFSLNNNYFPSYGKWNKNYGDIIVEASWGKEKIIKGSFIESISGNNYSYDIRYTLDNFIGDSSIFNKDLAYLSFYLNNKGTLKENIKLFYDELGFENISSYNYETIDKDNVAFTIASKPLKDTSIVSISLRSGNYGIEWSNNFKLNKEGDHQGFLESALKVYQELDNYLNEYQLDKDNVKLWISGYSRGGGVANLLSHYLIKEYGYDVSNLYTYTFEAPRGVLESNVRHYPSIFNIYNSADIVSIIAPIEYGLSREGIDINVYSLDVDKLYLDEYGASLPSLIESTLYQNDEELLNHIINNLLISYSSETDMHDRDHFVDNYQSSIQYMIELFYSLNEPAIKRIQREINQKEQYDLMLMITSEDGLYNFLYPIFDRYMVNYNKEDLRLYTNRMKDLVIGPASSIIGLYFSQGISFERLISFHMPEMAFVLMKNYIKDLEESS